MGETRLIQYIKRSTRVGFVKEEVAKMKKILYWFRNDLRLTDNAPLQKALANAAEIAFIYVHDPRVWNLTSAGIPRLGWHRRRFLKESLDNLRQLLEADGYKLVELWGFPEQIIPEITQIEKFNSLYFSLECAPGERAIESELKQKSHALGFEIKAQWSQFLFDPENLIAELLNIPQTFTDFRKKIEKEKYETFIPEEMSSDSQLRAKPTSLLKTHGLDLSELNKFLGTTTSGLNFEWWNPSSEEQNTLERIKKDSAPTEKFRLIRGGCTAGERRIEDYFFGSKAVSNYFETRNGLLNSLDSTLFSSWLAQGCISPRSVYRRLKDYEKMHGSNKSTYWVFFELLWREFFKLHLLNAGESFFIPHGLYRVVQENEYSESHTRDKIELILNCSTGQPFVDANMRELIQTGYMSNRGRQNVASYMIYELNIPWVLGASMFESFLIDYDVASNWGNWSYIAGVSFDPRGGRNFNVEKQQRDYDPDGSYVAAWSR